MFLLRNGAGTSSSPASFCSGIFSGKVGIEALLPNVQPHDAKIACPDLHIQWVVEHRRTC